MLDRLERPCLTVETGEAYQPIRLTYLLRNKENLLQTFEKLQCLEKSATSNTWTWYWRAECDAIHFESTQPLQRKTAQPIRLGTFVVRDETLYINLPSLRRASLAAPFWHRILGHDVAFIQHADFINKVFALNERLPHGFAEIFKDENLDSIIQQRIDDYHHVIEQCENAETAEEAIQLLNQYTQAELHKRLPYAERYVFDTLATIESDIVFLGFYVFLRGRELVALNRWLGQAGYTLSDATDETINQVMGEMDLSLFE